MLLKSNSSIFNFVIRNGVYLSNLAMAPEDFLLVVDEALDDVEGFESGDDE